ncbi:MAG: restriction endonuclease subunit S [Aeromonas sobria]
MSHLDTLITDHLDLWSAAVRPKSSAGRGSNSKLELTGIKKLRELILELAVRGKLVPQDPSDEPASVLLERIAAEKARLVKENKIKKEKPLPEISEDEKPFPLPVGWEWCRLEDVVDIQSGVTKGRKIINRDITTVPYLSVANVQRGYVDVSEVKSVELPVDEIGKYRVMGGDLLITEGGDWDKVGRTAIWANELPYVAHQNHVFKARKFIAEQDESWLEKYLNGPLARNYFAGSSKQTTNLASINKTQLRGCLIAVPPSFEKERIVFKVDQLMALCDQLEQRSESQLAAHQTLVEALLTTLTDSGDADELAQNWARLSTHFDTLFATEASIDALKQTILQLAVMGKLVPQDPSDEPASALLERIAAKKAQLVKEKKIKKEKPLPAISEDEKPFEIPQGWEWCRFEDIVDIQSGITKGRKLTNRVLTTVPYLSVANVQRGYVDVTGIKSVELPVDEVEKYQVLTGDLLITEGGDWDKVGRTAIWADEMPYVAHQNHVFKARKFLQEQDESWLEMFLNGPSARDYFAGSSKQTTNLASINKTQLRGCLIAIPPKNEKSCIVAKVDELMTLCDQLKSRLQTSQQTQLALAESLVAGALA